MKLESVVPFGRSLDEYRKMFNLTNDDLRLNILGVGDGPASFNAELTAQRGNVISVDPIYAFDAEEIRRRFYAVVDGIMEQVNKTPNDWVWSYHSSPQSLRKNRENVTNVFSEDYSQHHDTGRYIQGSLPTLPFSDNSFELALCSHFLFLYSDLLSYNFHEQSIREMLRVAQEIRVFPLITLMLERSSYIVRLHRVLEGVGYTAEIQKVDYELQKGGNEMLVVKRDGQ